MLLILVAAFCFLVGGLVTAWGAFNLALTITFALGLGVGPLQLAPELLVRPAIGLGIIAIGIACVNGAARVRLPPPPPTLSPAVREQIEAWNRANAPQKPKS